MLSNVDQKCKKNSHFKQLKKKYFENSIFQEFARLDTETSPEIKRCAISHVILQMLSIGIKNLAKFDFLEPPPKESIDGALRQLKLLNAIEIHDENEISLTDLGKQMAAFPLDPKFTKAIIAAKELGCT